MVAGAGTAEMASGQQTVQSQAFVSGRNFQFGRGYLGSTGKEQNFVNFRIRNVSFVD